MNYKKLSFIILKYFLMIVGLFSIIHFWQVPLSKIGFWNFLIGITLYSICQGLAKSIDSSDVIKYD
jgi:hypothetical protein